MVSRQSHSLKAVGSSPTLATRMKHKITLDFGPGDIVTLRTDHEHAKRMVTRVMIGHEKEYGLRRGDDDITWHSAMEIENYVDKKVAPGFKPPVSKRKYQRKAP